MGSLNKEVEYAQSKTSLIDYHWTYVTTVLRNYINVFMFHLTCLARQVLNFRARFILCFACCYYSKAVCNQIDTIPTVSLVGLWLVSLYHPLKPWKLYIRHTLIIWKPEICMSSDIDLGEKHTLAYIWRVSFEVIFYWTLSTSTKNWETIRYNEPVLYRSITLRRFWRGMHAVLWKSIIRHLCNNGG